MSYNKKLLSQIHTPLLKAQKGKEIILPKAQLGLLNPVDMGMMASKVMNFFGMNKPKIVTTPASGYTKLNIRDPRKIMMTTGKPLRPNSDLVNGDYETYNLDNLINEAKRNKMSYDNMMNLATMGFQETKWGREDGNNIGHVKNARDFGSTDDSEGSNYTDFINAYNAKMKEADRLKIKDEATRLQVYNGLGKVFPSTEDGYHGFKMKKIYGVPVPKEGIDLKKNPLYGKQIIDLRENVLKKSPEFMRYIDSAYNAPMPADFGYGGQPCYDCGGMYADGGPIEDPMGQWAHPGEITRIPGNRKNNITNITMKGVNYPVLGIGSNGQKQMMYPNQEYSFGGAEHVDEYPMMGKGGEMIRRADGSYSKRGLWDNIRANEGSGKKPSKEMLEQEKKIKAKNMANGGTNNAGFEALPDYVQAKILTNMGYGGYYNPIMAEGGEPNGGMALGQMMAVADKMNKLRQFISPDKNLDPWIASKLAVMDESADAISDYMMYNPEAQEMQEGISEMGNGGYTVTRSNDRKGKTHKVTGPDGTVKYFGDSNLGQHPKDPKRKAAFYARHKHNLDNNPFFRAFARKTWEDGGSTFSGNAFYQDGGYTSVADYAKASGRGASYKERKAMAELMGISGYRGTEDQNMQLLNMLKSQDQQARYSPADMDNSEHTETPDQIAARVSNIKSAYSKIKNNASPIASPTKKTIATAQQQQKPADMTYEQFMSLANSVGPKLVSQKQVEAMRDKNGYLSEIKNTPVAIKPKEDNKVSSNKVIKEFMNNIGAGNSINFSNYNKPAVVNSTKSAKDEEVQKANDAIVMKYMKRKEKESDSRYLESGTIVDKGTNMTHVIQNGKVIKSFPVLTGQAGKNPKNDINKNPFSAQQLNNNPQGRSTPTGTYFMEPQANIYGWPGYDLNPIDAFDQPAPVATNTAMHITYGAAPKPGMSGHPDKQEFKKRNAAYSLPAANRYKSFGCTNMQGEDIDCMQQNFPKGDTAIYIDSRKGKDAKFLNNTYGIKAYGGNVNQMANGGIAKGQEMEVTPEEAEILRQQGYQFEII